MCHRVSVVTQGSSDVTERHWGHSALPDPGRPRRQNWWIAFLSLAALGAVGVFLTLVWFVNPTTDDIDTVQSADAVVLFAGVEDRLDTAIELMERGVAPNLVIPNGNSVDEGADLCDGTTYRVFCPDTRTIDTVGEAETIGLLAREEGWSNLIAVTSTYHVHRATSLLGRCFEGGIVAVTPDQGLGREELVEKVPREWAGYLASFIFGPNC
jgi:uncharacterized SAM-binding protein YcdF (DUF218 family)